jgi:methylthioribulose-1-phosphate dehydratase
MSKPRLTAIARKFGDLGGDFYARGWVLGTSGNFSAVLSRAPLELAITVSGASKGSLRAADVLVVDADGVPVGDASGRPSAETALHLAIVRARGAGAVLHTHSIWSTVLSGLHAPDGGLTIQGLEMLKGLEGVTTHRHVEWVPVFENTQDIPALAREVETMLGQFPAVHGFLLRGHGLYTWGVDVAQARRHVEIFEFLLEAAGRMRTLRGPHAGGSYGAGENP